MADKQPAPTDEACAEAWSRIMRIAEDHALIVAAYGGTATLAMPEEQRRAGVREQTLRAHTMRETEGG